MDLAEASEVCESGYLEQEDPAWAIADGVDSALADCDGHLADVLCVLFAGVSAFAYREIVFEAVEHIGVVVEPAFPNGRIFG